MGDARPLGCGCRPRLLHLHPDEFVILCGDVTQRVVNGRC